MFHIIAESKGGANHTDNFWFVGHKLLNIKLGNRYDEVLAYLAGPQAAEAAVDISRNKPKDHLTTARPRRSLHTLHGPRCVAARKGRERSFLRDVLYAAKTAKKEGGQ